MVAGLEDITSGKLVIDNEVVNEVLPKDRDIAMVFQSYALYPHMTVSENMGFGLKMQKSSEDGINERVEDVAESIGLHQLLERLPKELSGGQRQRVALGRAIVRNPKVFLMDEHLSNLDAKLRVHTRAELIELHERLKTTTIYVTHDQVEAMTMADRIVVMNHGIIQQVGTPREIYLKPNNEFVASFIGAPAMNFATMTVGQEGLNSEVWNINLSQETLSKLQDMGYANKEIHVGIRPEHIYLADDVIQLTHSIPLNVKIRIAEMLGNETLLHFELKDTDFVSKVVTLDQFESGQSIDLKVDLNHLHFFDMETGNRIDIPDFGIYNKYLSPAAVESGE